MLTQIRGGWRAGAVVLAALAVLAPVARAADAAEPERTAAAADAAASAIAGIGADLALQALALVGVPYRFGSEDPARGFDCSGLVRHVVRAVLGQELPRSSEAIARVGQSVRSDALQGGDLVFFNTRGHRNSHVGVYIGDGRFVHAPARNGLVRVEALADRYWRVRFNGARRVHGDAAAGTGAPADRASPPAEPRYRPDDPAGSNASGGA